MTCRKSSLGQSGSPAGNANAAHNIITDNNNNESFNNNNTVLVLSGLMCPVLQGQHSVLSCTWNKPATKLFVGSVDHNLRVFGPPAS